MPRRFTALRSAASVATAALGLMAAAAWADVTYVSPSQARLKEDVAFLAADAQEGRAPGTKGIEASAEYIANAFKEIGLKPAPGADGFFQTFTIRGNAELIAPPTLAFQGPGDRKIEPIKGTFQPLSIGSGGTLKDVPIVFVGYGITAKDDSKNLDYDDYAGIDVRDKVVLLLRREPQMEDEKSPFAGKQTTIFATFAHKATNAFQHGAAAVLLVNDLAGLKGGDDQLMRFNAAGGEENSPIPFVMMTRSVADEILAASGQPRLETLEKEIDADLKPRSRALEGWKTSGIFDIVRKGLATKNVVGVLEAVGPQADETIVVGAHYDHLGHGGPANPGSMAFLARNQIHNGADDNASGTALVMELARRLSKRADPLPRRIVFMAFSGEEKGLLGSRHYVEHPLIPLDKTVLMINFDMVGRLNDKSELTVVGTGSTAGIEGIVDSLGSAAGFKVKKVKGMSDGFGGSDHESFYLKNVPILFPFTGLHGDYHRPSDDTERINFVGMSRIADFGELVLLDVSRRPTRPEFTKVAEPANPHGGSADPGRVGMGAYLGTVPDYGAEDKGVKLSAVREGSPAEKGGIKGGDVIVGFAGKPIATIYDYTDNLGRAKPGDQVEIVVKRDGKDVTLNVTLGSRPGATP